MSIFYKNNQSVFPKESLDESIKNAEAKADSLEFQMMISENPKAYLAELRTKQNADVKRQHLI